MAKSLIRTIAISLAILLTIILIVNALVGYIVVKLDVGFTFWDGFFKPGKTLPQAIKIKSDKIIDDMLPVFP